MTTNAYNEVLNENIELEDVDYKTFNEILKGWTEKLISHGGSKATVIEVIKKQQRALTNEGGKEKFKTNIERWLNENK